jgi:hypothetical protein
VPCRSLFYVKREGLVSYMTCEASGNDEADCDLSIEYAVVLDAIPGVVADGEMVLLSSRNEPDDLSVAFAFALFSSSCFQYWGYAFFSKMFLTPSMHSG